jgi:hypothetical protein
MVQGSAYPHSRAPGAPCPGWSHHSASMNALAEHQGTAAIMPVKGNRAVRRLSQGQLLGAVRRVDAPAGARTRQACGQCHVSRWLCKVANARVHATTGEILAVRLLTAVRRVSAPVPVPGFAVPPNERRAVAQASSSASEVPRPSAPSCLGWPVVAHLLGVARRSTDADLAAKLV